MYWKEQLSGAPSTLELPADRPRPAGPAGHGSLHLFTFKRHLAEAVKALSQEQGVSLFTTLIATSRPCSFATADRRICHWGP